MNASVFLMLLCLGIASAAPTVDHSLDAEANKLIAIPRTIVGVLKGVLKDVLQSVIGSVVKTLVGGKALSLQTVVNAPADEVTAEFQAGDVLIPEPEAQEAERAAVENPWPVGLGEEGHGTPAMSK
uniref:Uncharacterized protein n=1 Tax=Myotis myotis TaxID=51298 RepID=A0A7J7UQ57_MYOMY|nr:hypothetical protein mMyoMyo1_008698 [Myotis myotis]